VHLLAEQQFESTLRELGGLEMLFEEGKVKMMTNYRKSRQHKLPFLDSVVELLYQASKNASKEGQKDVLAFVNSDIILIGVNVLELYSFIMQEFPGKEIMIIGEE